MDSERLAATSRRRLDFAIKYGIDTFIFIRRCFEIAPLKDRPDYWNDLVEIVSLNAPSYCLPDNVQHSERRSYLDILLTEYLEILDTVFKQEASVALLPPAYTNCPLGCRYKANNAHRKLATQIHDPTQAIVFELNGTSRKVFVLKRACRGCHCVLEYDMLYHKKCYQFYTVAQPYHRITPNVYFARNLCEHIVSALARGRQTFEGFADLWQDAYKFEGGFDRKWVSISFYRHEVEAVLRESGSLIRTPFITYNSYDEVLPFLERERMKSSFPHVTTPKCLLYKCDKFLIADGIWGINHIHCTAPVQNVVTGYPKLNLPPVCPNQPQTGSLYCSTHLKFLQNVPATQLEARLKNSQRDLTETDISLLLGCPEMHAFFGSVISSSAEALSFQESLPYECSKNIGPKVSAKKKINSAAPSSAPTKGPRSLGLLLNVRPCGQINSAVSLYRSESPSQVFLTIVNTLYNHVVENEIPPSEWPKMFVVYDNACNLDRIQAAQSLLPLPPPYDRLFLDTSKSIDVFHLRNHVREECRSGKYSPKNIMLAHPDLKKRNTEAAEQANAWLSRFIAVLNRIPRDRQLFYLARLIYHRNNYLQMKNGGEVQHDEDMEAPLC